MTKKFIAGLACLTLVGCMPHFKETDSYGTNFEDSYSNPESMKPMPNAGDPYTFGGIAEGSGGQMARQSYATDSDSPDFRDATATGVMGEIAKDRTTTEDPSGQGLPGTAPNMTGSMAGNAAAAKAGGSFAPNGTNDPTIVRH